MSQENYKKDSKRWLKQSEADLRAEEGSLKNKNFEWSCFQSQQAAEKALKSLYYYCLLEPWDHSVVKLISEFPKRNVKKEISTLMDKARELDKLYIPTRYPIVLPDLTPSEVFTKNEAKKAITKKIQEIEKF